MPLITLVLPIVWAIVSAGIAGLLYRSSEAVFEGDNLLGMPAKKVRLGGSIVCAVVIFLLIRQATPTENLNVVPRGTVSISNDKYNSLVQESRALESASIDLNGCLQMSPASSPCADQSLQMRQAAGAMHDDISVLKQQGADTK